ncbi:MAG: DMT family transporter, partial [Usitatibacteraceae bacterium]
MKPSINAGIAASLVSSIGFAAMDALTKQLVTTLSPAHLLLFRSAMILLLFVPLAAFFLGRDIFRTQAWAETLWRSLLFALTSALIVVSLRYLTLAETISIYFICPALTVLLAAWWLGEKVTLAAIAACAIGFVGIALIVQPFQSADQAGHTLTWAYALPVLAAVAGAVQDVLSRKLKDRASPSTLLIFGVLATAICGASLGGGEALTVPGRTESLLL